MRKFISVMLTVFLILSSMTFLSVSAGAAVPTADDLCGYENVCLTYTFRTSGYNNGRHYTDDLMPYTAYLDANGNIKDFFFDSYLFLPCLDYGPSGARMHVDVNNPTKAQDWTAYVNDTFASGANVDALEDAYGRTKAALNDTQSKAGVFFTILYPCRNAYNFGTLGGRSLNFSLTADRKYAIKWMIDEQISRFRQAGYNNLDLVGFYWLEEFLVEEADVQLIQYASEYLHSKGLKFIWIPWYQSNGHTRWQSLGFDVACMQPNLMWMSYHDPDRVKTSISISEQYGMGMELEIDLRVTQDDYFNRYLDYLDGGITSNMKNGVKMYYQDGKPAVYYTACHSQNARLRLVYDLTYKYAKGTLTQYDISSVRPGNVGNNYVDDIDLDNLMSVDVDWISVGKEYYGCASFVDGSGAPYQNVDGKELTDGKLAYEELSTDWHAFHISLTDGNGRMSATIDLGEIRTDLTHFAAHFDNRLKHGIGAPVNIEISISNDAQTYYTLASPNLTLDTTNSCFKYESDEPVTARFVKMAFDVDSRYFIFCSEFLVGVRKEYVEGDVNNDRKLTATDYLMLKQLVFGTKDVTEIADQKTAMDRCDQNGDNKLTATDYFIVKKSIFS